MEDLTVRQLSRHRADLSPYTSLALPDHEDLVTAMQKDRVLGLAEGLGIPVPATWRLRAPGELEDVRDRLPGPGLLESRVVPNTRRILRHLERRRVRATFFVLGVIARRPRPPPRR